MATLLYVKSSILGEAGNSTQISNSILEAWKAANPDGQVVVRDLNKPLPRLDMRQLGALMTPADMRSDKQKDIVAIADEVIAEVKNADAILFGLPMYNFNVPSQVKDWFDLLARAGVTFRYTENGSEGLIGDRPVLVVAARGGIYVGTPNDHQEPYVRMFLSFIGINDVRFIHVEGVNLGTEPKEKALNEARARTAEAVAFLSGEVPLAIAAGE